MAKKTGKTHLKEHAAIIASVKNYDNPWQVPRRRKGKWSEPLGLPSKGEVLYFAGCSTALLSPETAANATRLIEAVGVVPAVLGDAERCCGSTARKLGDEALARAKVEECFADFARAGAKTVVTSCPGCSSALNHYPGLTERYGIEVVHISRFLDSRRKRLEFKSPTRQVITYHDPCDLGRTQGIYDEPRRLIHATGASVVEMGLSREFSACCGSGAGVKSSFPELAAAIGRDRLLMARAAGADTVVTSCPWCVQNLNECQQDKKELDVVDLVDLLAERLLSKGKR